MPGRGVDPADAIAEDVEVFRDGQVRLDRRHVGPREERRDRGMDPQEHDDGGRGGDVERDVVADPDVHGRAPGGERERWA